MRTLPKDFYRILGGLDHYTLFSLDGSEGTSRPLVKPDDTTEIDITFAVNPDVVSGWSEPIRAFGCSNTSSATSAGSFTLSKAKSAAYFTLRYGSTNYAFSNVPVSGETTLRFILKDKKATLIGNKMQEYDLPESAFSSPSNAFLVLNGMDYIASSMHNIVAGGTRIMSAKVWHHGELLGGFISCIDKENGLCSLYDVSTGIHMDAGGRVEFLANISFAESSDGSNDGYACIRSGNDISSAIFTAHPPVGFMFSKWKWEVSDCQHESAMNPLVINSSDYVTPYETLTVVPEFIEKPKHQDDPYILYIKKSTEIEGKPIAMCIVDKAHVKMDLLQKSTAVINLSRVDGSLFVGDVALLCTPTGECIYQGVIESIKEMEITCREIQSLFDVSFLFHPNSSIPANAMDTTMTTAQKLNQYTIQSALERAYLYDFKMGRLTDNTSIENMDGQTFDRFNAIEIVKPSELSDSPEAISRSQMIGSRIGDFCPQIDKTSVMNFEQWLFSIYKEFGVFISFDIPIGEGTPYMAAMSPDYATTVAGNNVEAITDVSVTKEDSQTPTLLYIYNSSGATLRYVYVCDYNGYSYCLYKGSARQDVHYIMPSNYNPAIVMSDDKVNTIVTQYLSSSTMNHKITFSVHFSKLYGFDSFKLGQKVGFYYFDELYDSKVTGIEYEIVENDITSMNVTLGKVRNSLTSKINMLK